MVELAHDIWVNIVHMAKFILAGTWFEITLTILGITGALFTIQQIHNRLRNKSVLISVITKTVMIIAGLYWLLLMIAVTLVAFVNS